MCRKEVGSPSYSFGDRCGVHPAELDNSKAHLESSFLSLPRVRFLISCAIPSQDQNFFPALPTAATARVQIHSIASHYTFLFLHIQCYASCFPRLVFVAIHRIIPEFLFCNSELDNKVLERGSSVSMKVKPQNVSLISLSPNFRPRKL